MQLEDKPQDKYYGLVAGLIFDENLWRKMLACHAVLNSLEPDLSKKVNANRYKKYLDKLMADTELMRRVKLMSKIKEHPETAIEYFGPDYLSNPEYDFDAEIEKIMTDIHKELNIFIGNLLRESQKSEELDIG